MKTDSLNASIEALQAQLAVPLATDPMPEAGRKVLLGQFIRMLEYEAGSRTGADLEDVHKMRVAIRHMRSLFRLMEGFYKPRSTESYIADLRRVMRVLGAVRDLDVMTVDLEGFRQELANEEATAMQDVIDLLDMRRGEARKALVKCLNSKRYRRFMADFSTFLTTPSAGVAAPSTNMVIPYEVRHALPPLVATQLAQVRAYDSMLAEADAETLHDLRIHFKRLRYSLSLFADLLGAQAGEVIEEIKKMQDLLGRLNDIEVAKTNLTELMDDLEGHQNAVIWRYIDRLESERPALLASLPDAWKRFNGKTVQRKLASAVAAM